MSSDPNDRPDSEQPQSEPQTPQGADSAAETPDEAAQRRRRILIGSQRDPVAYRPKPKRDWIPASSQGRKPEGSRPTPEVETKKPAPVVSASEPLLASSPSAASSPVAQVSADSSAPVVTDLPAGAPTTAAVSASTAQIGSGQETIAAIGVYPAAAATTLEAGRAESPSGPPRARETRSAAARERRGGRNPRRNRQAAEDEEESPETIEVVTKKLPPPNIRDRLSPDLEAELEAAMADVSLEEAIAGGDSVTAQAILEADSQHTGRVVTVTREDVFVELGGREQGIVPLRLFTAEPPQPGAELAVTVVRYNREDGLYELTLPHMAANVGDWSQVSEGMLVEAKVTGHNAGGLECEVNRIRAFIPISQVALYRVENLEEFVEQKLLCLVAEANPDRRNLVLSRRAVLEREKEEARQKMFESLAPGQIYEGLVRKIMDFGAFVELGNGVDGLLHISQLGWGRVKHPTDVVQEGQRIRVRVDKVDPETGRIGLSYRDLMENPWDTADRKYVPSTPYRGRVVKIMEFGAFVELEPGVEGLVHISELSHKRVVRVSDVVKEGDEIERDGSLRQHERQADQPLDEGRSSSARA